VPRPVISTSEARRNLLAENHCYYVYIITNWNDKVMYIGMTNDLERRIYEHKHKLVKGFTEKYNVSKLVYFEQASDAREAIAREKEIKKWRREKKNNLVESTNPQWRDLSNDWGKDFSLRSK
jgi:putative endonuclease